ncbi:Uncharacterized protein BM_BM10925 [Brugia malayi]|uniref:Bm10925, isoform e n=2 Tax=Brugia malayi TaxID=6279 RepID=A0A1P6BHV9_BRUMA|nr:Uncharacterized protein BM_BM10925 [Brugia malayi]CDQ00465.1 Bm10925, isoform e [Brugia malayi]VIO86271.1 Uncharacterized protein BM_BM10925 [Brugia malayi]
MKTLQVFHLIKTSAYQLTDFNHSTSVPVLFLLKTGTKPMIEMLPSSLHFTSRKTGIDSRMPSGSLLSLRTFYAFGARSGRAPLLQRSLSHNAHGSSTYAGSLQQSTEKSITIQRSSTSSLIHSPKRSITYYNRRYLTSSSNISKPYSSTVVNIHRFSKWDNKENHQMRTGQIVLPKILRNTGIITMQSSISTRNSYHIENGAVLQRCEQPVNIPASPETKSEISKPQEDSAEMIVLIGKNQALEAEVKRLTLKLREKERSEREFRRKILEYAAEIKVWKKKYEMQKLAATIEISEVKGNEEEISDIMEQLNNAAEKLTRLDAVKDLKLLQSEMETALKEISK